MNRGFAKIIIPILILVIFLIIGASKPYFFRKNTVSDTYFGKEAQTNIVDTSSDKSNSLISLEIIKSMFPTISWEDPVKDTRSIYKESGDNLTDLEYREVSGTSVFSKQIFPETSFGKIDEKLTEQGWVQSAGADGPMGSLLGYSIKQGGKERYLEFSYNSGCKANNLQCTDGSVIFLSDEFEW